MNIINDAVHGVIELPDYIMSIINTPAFQRLRDIRQLGVSPFVYPSATHTRFEHSIGTFHLASRLVQQLQLQQQAQNENSGAQITQQHRICVEIAALCHDIGHGPLSHFWEFLISRTSPDDWSHEEQSICVINNLMCDQSQRVWQMLHEQHGLTESHVQLIGQLIRGVPVQNAASPVNPALFQIVANKQSGMDVDKWDYLVRDSHYVGSVSGLTIQQIERLIKSARIVPLPSGKSASESGRKLATQSYAIAFRDKEYLNVLDIFKFRYHMNRAVYQHKSEIVIREMMCDFVCALIKEGRLGNPVQQANSLSDSAIWHWFYSNSEVEADVNGLKRGVETGKEAKSASQQLANRIMTRDLYKVVGSARSNSGTREISHHLNGKELRREIFGRKHHHEANTRSIYDGEEDGRIRVGVGNFSIGNIPDKDPLELVSFYSKSGQLLSSDELDSYASKIVRTTCCNETEVHVFITCLLDELTPEQIESTKKAFVDWCDINKFQVTWKLP